MHEIVQTLIMVWGINRNQPSLVHRACRLDTEKSKEIASQVPHKAIQCEPLTPQTLVVAIPCCRTRSGNPSYDSRAEGEYECAPAGLVGRKTLGTGSGPACRCAPAYSTRNAD